MALTFYPHPDVAAKGLLSERIEILMDAAEGYKAAILEMVTAKQEIDDEGKTRRSVPRDQAIAFNGKRFSCITSDS